MPISGLGDCRNRLPWNACLASCLVSGSLLPSSSQEGHIGAPVSKGHAVGEGTEVRLSAAGVIGAGLVVDRRVVHLSAFSAPTSTAHRDRRPRGHPGRKGNRPFLEPIRRQRAPRMGLRRLPKRVARSLREDGGGHRAAGGYTPLDPFEARGDPARSDPTESVHAQGSAKSRALHCRRTARSGGNGSSDQAEGDLAEGA